MQTDADIIIDGLGGTSAVAKLIHAPTSTVHSWRANGIPPSRLEHLKLAAGAHNLTWPAASPDGMADSAQDAEPSAGKSEANSPCSDLGAAA